MHLVFFENTHHKSLNHNARDTLYAHYKYSLRTLFCSRTTTISDGVLSLDTEEEATGETKDVIDARCPIAFHLKRRQVGLLEVPMCKSD